MTAPAPRALVLDTNVVLDLLVFGDARARALSVALEQAQLRWIHTAPMRDEFERVLDYPHLRVRREYHGLSVSELLARLDQRSVRVTVPPKADVTCKDPDDQKFIDLALAHGAVLLSKDHAVLSMRKRCAQRGAWVGAEWPAGDGSAW